MSTCALPVESDWFRITRVDDAITRMEEPFADPWISANMWHIRGRDCDVVIDTGLGVASLKGCLDAVFPDREPARPQQRECRHEVHPCRRRSRAPGR